MDGTLRPDDRHGKEVRRASTLDRVDWNEELVRENTPAEHAQIGRVVVRDVRRPWCLVCIAFNMTDPSNRPELEDQDELVPVTRESSRGGHEPPPDESDRPDQNVAYDEVVKGAPLTPEERARAERESPLSE